jgi:hypothetical protein
MKKTKFSLVEFFSGAPMFERVLKVLESKQFISPSLQKAADDVVVGVMSPFERACYSFLQESNQKINVLGNCPNPFNKIDNDCLNNIIVEIGICPFSDQLLALKKEYPNQKEIRIFMFGLIRSRLKETYPDIESIKLCEGFLITASTKIAVPDTMEKFAGFKRLSMEKMLENSFKNTFMAPVFEILKTGEFVSTDEPIKDGEILVHEMGDFEKALWMYISQVVGLSENKRDEMKKLLHDGSNVILDLLTSFLNGKDNSVAKGKSYVDDLSEKTNKFIKENSDLKAIIDPMDSLLWNMIKSVIPQEKLDVYDLISIREGFKVVMSNR